MALSTRVDENGFVWQKLPFFPGGRVAGGPTIFLAEVVSWSSGFISQHRNPHRSDHQHKSSKYFILFYLNIKGFVGGGTLIPNSVIIWITRQRGIVPISTGMVFIVNLG